MRVGEASISALTFVKRCLDRNHSSISVPPCGRSPDIVSTPIRAVLRIFQAATRTKFRLRAGAGRLRLEVHEPVRDARHLVGDELASLRRSTE
jgi:hypothetical protein